MINSTWVGIINWDNGININNVKKQKIVNNNISNNKNIKNSNEIINITKDINDKDINDKYINDKDINDKYINDKDINDKDINDKDINDKDINDKDINDKDINDKDINDKDILQNVNYFNFKNSKIPYYNENTEYLHSYTINNKKYNNNYYKLLDRMGNISKFILKGNDYYRLYISKNSNKYFNTTEDINNDTKNSKMFNSLQNDKLSNNIKHFSKINIVYQEIEKSNYNENEYNEEYL